MRPDHFCKNSAMNDKIISLPGKRLSAAASFIRQGAFFADIGTDHALLPIYAVMTNTAVSAVASDVNEGPLSRARENIDKNGLSDRIECRLASGFEGMDDLPITDAAICGMGGELIADIISSADFIRSDGFRLIVQPMTMAEVTRRALGRLGFVTVGEKTVREDRKFYTVIAAEYDGIIRQPDDFTAFFGHFSDGDGRFENECDRRDYIMHEITKFERIIKGKRTAGLDVSFELAMNERLTGLLK